MRFELAGSLIRPDPLLIKLEANASFDTLDFIEKGYTHFDVICIGAGGGNGGGIDTANTGTLVKNYGGAGGGGGFHRVVGLLSALPGSCSIVVGQAGANGTNHASDPALTTNGADGGASTFNDTTCRASGGKGGKRAQSNSTTVGTQANGGDGGVGDRTIAGGGALGGVAGVPTATGPGTPGTNGADGSFFQNIGKGGGGGAGGVGKYGSGGTTLNAATSGGKGVYNPGDLSVYGPGDPPSNDPITGSQNIVPGKASGAKAAPLNKLPTVYGRSAEQGVVIILVTSNVTSKKPAPPPVPGSTIFGRVQKTFIFARDVQGNVAAPTPTGYGAGNYGSGTYSGTPEYFGQVLRPITFGAVVAGIGSAPPPKQTSVAEISLASHVAPSSRINHAIVVRARSTPNPGAVIKVALYEGATNRSGDLTSAALTTSLADYVIPISNAAAAAITSYANLSIKIWGYDAAGRSILFEVSRLYLRLPTT